MQGAASYDLSVDQPDGTHRDYSDIRTPAASFIKMTGTGVWHWRVRAEFPKDSAGDTSRARTSATQSFTRTIGEPANAKTDSAKDHVLLSWDPRLGVKEYKVQIASSPDFSRAVETVSTDNPSYAPTMTLVRLHDGEHALLARRRASTRTATRATGRRSSRSACCPRLRVSVSGLARHKRVEHRARDRDGRAGQAAVRRAKRAPDRRGHPAGHEEDGQASARSSFKVKPKKKGKLVCQRDEGRLPAGLRSAEGAMKPVRTKPAPRPKVTLRIWRVFEYRRPVPVRRPRFTI